MEQGQLTFERITQKLAENVKTAVEEFNRAGTNVKSEGITSKEQLQMMLYNIDNMVIAARVMYENLVCFRHEYEKVKVMLDEKTDSDRRPD